MTQDADPQAEQHAHEESLIRAMNDAANEGNDHFLGKGTLTFGRDEPSWPNLAGVVNAEEIEAIGTGKFQASYLNWARTMHHMHVSAPGWLPFAEPAADGGLIHQSPAGCYMMIGFRNMHTQACTPLSPQAVMDNKNKAIAYKSITARDITDTHRRGLCQAAAMFFGLAYELWAKDEIESGCAKQERANAEAKAKDDAEKTAQAKNLIALLEVKCAPRAQVYREKMKLGNDSPQQIVHWLTGELKKHEEPDMSAMDADALNDARNAE